MFLGYVLFLSRSCAKARLTSFEAASYLDLYEKLLRQVTTLPRSSSWLRPQVFNRPAPLVFYSESVVSRDLVFEEEEAPSPPTRSSSLMLLGF